MTKIERLKYMEERFSQLEDNSIDCIFIPPSKDDIKNEIQSMDTYREHVKTCKSLQYAINTDEL